MNKLGARGAPHRHWTRASSSAGGTRRIHTYVRLIHMACTAYSFGWTQKKSWDQIGFCAEQTEDGLPVHPEVQSGAEKKNPVQQQL
eukprot:15367010-Ditylum_brightwellii.AAC.1